MIARHMLLGALTISLFVGCASSKPSPAQVEREARLAERLSNASAECASALKRVDRLERMKEKAESKTVGDAIAGVNNNYWAAIPIPGAKLLGASQKDRDELGMYNSEHCWKLSCVEEKLTVSRAEVGSQCESDEEKSPAQQANATKYPED